MRKILVLTVLLALAPSIYAQSCTTATCTAADVTTASVLAALPAPSNTNATVVVNIPAGTSNWTASIPSYSAPAAVTSLTIQGATTCTGSGDPSQNNLACTDNTIIQDNDTVDSNVFLGISTAGFLRITGITFQYGTGAVKNSGMLNPSAGNQIRIDHIHFNTDTGISASDLVDVTGCTTGVVDHVLVTNTTNKRTGNSIVAWNGVGCGGNNEGGGNFGDFVWSQPTGFGTSNFLFVEQSTVQGGPSAAPANSEVNDCLRGGRIVWRFNTQTNGAHLQTHPTGSANSQRGCRAYEAYGNNWLWTLPPVSGTQGSVSTILFYSSGPAIMWGNTFGTASAFGWASIIAFNGCRDSQGACGYNQQPGGTGGWGNCNGASVWDGNTGNGSNAGYACADQPTRGQGDLLAGQIQNNNKTDTAFSAPHYPRQALEPLYYWLNAYHQLPNGNNSCPSPVCANSDATQNVDYYLSSDPTSGTDCAGFTGATGVGCGARSARPATCTTGVAYWSTDQGSWNTSGNGFGNGVLDKCTATNIWTNAAYVPFTYPNPLEGGPVNPQAAAPSCLPGGGTYQIWTLVACTSLSTGVIECYTTDGSVPITNGTTGCTNGTKYATTPAGNPTPITVSASESLQIVAGGTGFSDSPVTSNSYVITGDQYGGRLDVTCTNATGNFTVVQIGNKWWFCTPQGHGFIMMSLTTGTTPTLLDCNNVNQGSPNYTAKYGDTTFNWGWQTNARASHWGFNASGQDSVAYTQPKTTCASCVWPGHIQPYPMPYVIEPKPAENAAQNIKNFVTSPLKDEVVGTNSHWQGYRGAAAYDAFDPGLATVWAGELADTTNPGTQAIKNNDPFLLYVVTDDSDFFSGAGASPDYILHVPAASAPNIAWTTLLTSPVQSIIMTTNVGSKRLVYTDTRMYSKTQALDPVTTCSIAAPCSLRDYLKQKYGTIAALNAAWGSNYTTFDSTATQVTGESFGTGDGTTTSFTHTTAHGNIDPFSIQMLIGGVDQIGDCPWAHSTPAATCLTSTVNTGTLASAPATLITQSTSTINYATGTITVNFAVAPAAGAAITINYQYGGWMQGGTGLMDEDGTNVAWVGTNNWCLEGPDPLFPTYSSCLFSGNGGNGVPNANPTLGADLDKWVGQFSAKYFKTMHDGLRAAGSRILYFGLDVTGSYGVSAYSQFDLGEAPYVDGFFDGSFQIVLSTDMTEWNSRLQYHTHYIGNKPFAMFNVSGAKADSAYACKNPGIIDYPTQSARGQGWFNNIQALLTTPSANGTIQYVGTNWWVNQDIQNVNEGLTSLRDNAYDGIEGAVATVPCDSYYSVLPGATCGGEASGMIQAITVGAGGSGYAANDTGFISTGNGAATYTVLTVAGGVVQTIALSGSGTSYSVQNLVPTTRGGGQPGAGTGLTVNITAIIQLFGDTITQVTAGNRLWLGSLTPPSTVTLTPTAIAFPSTPIGVQSAGQVATLLNSSGATITITGAGFTGTNSLDFSQTTTCGATLLNGASCTYTLKFTPSISGPESASFNVSFTGATGSPLSVALTGTGTGGAAATLTCAPLACGGGILGFGNQTPNTTSPAVTITLTSSGTSNLTLAASNAVTLTGTNSANFIISSNTCTNGLVIAPLSTCHMNVTFAPSIAGAFIAQINIVDNAPGSPQVIALTGTGVAPAPATGLFATIQ